VPFLLGPDDRKRTRGWSIYIVLSPKDAFPIAKEFWQYPGLGISSRCAEKYPSLLWIQDG
jgi:cystathionine gamma-synthase